MSKQFAVVGNWNFQKTSGKGLSSYTYDPETAKMEHICTVRDDVSVGNQFVDNDNGIIYITYEERNLRGYLGGGGYVLAFKIDKETGELTEISDTLSLAPLPSYIWVDKSKKYALVSNHVTSNVTTKVVKNPDGTYSPKTETDDAALVLYRLNDDGSIGEACDVYYIPSADKILSDPNNPRYAGGIPHMHSVVGDPTSELFVVCDKGVDKVYTFGIDRENGKIIYKSQFKANERSAPRYSVFHPTLPIVYENNENVTYIHTFKYDVESGELELLATTDLLQEHGGKGMPSDIAISQDGKFLYACTRGANILSVFSLDENGIPTLIQTSPCGGEGPRGMKISPDGKFVFIANLESGSVAIFKINDDGTVSDTGRRTEAPCPGNISIVG
jgi:6-phosphogluconolactonase (cycloisomerase 2 family)